MFEKIRNFEKGHCTYVVPYWYRTGTLNTWDRVEPLISNVPPPPLFEPGMVTLKKQSHQGGLRGGCKVRFGATPWVRTQHRSSTK
jgi:hypothetical protein